MFDQYDIGEPITLTGTFIRTADGALANPTSIALTITHADGSVVVKAIGDLTNVSTGEYTYDLVAVANGVMSHRWVAAGNGVGSDTTEYVLIGNAEYDGPCDLWCDPTDIFDVRPASNIATADRDYGRAAEAVAAASRILFVLSDRRYPGICVETVRPCRRSRFANPPGWHSSWGTCDCASLSACSCGGGSEVRLGPDYPVLGVRRVRVDGDTLTSAAYRIDDGNWLVRLDGDGWPGGQDLTLDPATDTGTFDVTYYYGRVAPPDAVTAARRLAAELYVVGVPGATCSLPQRVQTISRREESISFLDPMEFLADGKTGLYEVDLFLSAERYDATHQGTIVASPDFTAGLRRT